MSGDQSATSSGYPSARPHTPRQTPTTSAALSSPIFETPKAHHESRLADPGTWTPRFAEEYSVFDFTPGDNTSSRDTFTACTPAASTSRSRTPSYLSKGPLTAGKTTGAIESHANHFSTVHDSPSVDPTTRASSSQLPSSIHREYSAGLDIRPTQIAPTSVDWLDSNKTGTKRGQDFPTQTATPPPSARKADRNLVPDSTPTTMQNDEGYGHQDFMGPAQQTDATAFSFAQNDMFGYPMSAPVTGSPSFWDSSMSMSAMDLDFASHHAATSGMLFETPASSQQPAEPYDWNANAALFQDASAVANMPPRPSNQENVQPAPRRNRPLQPKPSMADPATQPAVTAADTADVAGPYLANVNEGFVLSPGRGVDPGLLFSRPPSSDSTTDQFHPGGQHEPAGVSLADPAPLISRSDAVRRSHSYKETGRRGARETASSPIKPSAPNGGLQRSFSEDRGRRQLPTLAPAGRPQAPQTSGSGVAANRPLLPRQSGRLSPSKLHHRLSNLTSIPESSSPRTRTSVKFTIDARGRAHAETTVVVDEPTPNGVYRRSSRDSSRRSHVAQSDSEDSDTDDEPIIIPSRNASFALPDPHKPVGSIFHSSGRKSPGARPSFSSDDHNRRRHSYDDGDESEAETVVHGGASKGDATSELRKVVEDRQKRAAGQRSRQLDTGGFAWAAGNLMSPTTLPDSSIPTPSTGHRHYRIRCVCHRNEPGGAMDTFMVQCEACELWLHGRCINITRRDMPPVYICAFCANTPSMRGGRVRDTGRAPVVPSGHTSSPLAHKSFKSFR